MPGPSFIVRAPATTANMGPGFDCLGMALNLWNEVAVAPAARLTIEIEGEGHDSLPRDERNIIFQALQGFYLKRGEEPPALALRCKNRIPLFRGLGSSAAAIVSGLVAANHLLGRPAGRTEILQEAAAIEGHGDNVAPAIFGGCQVVFKDNDIFLHSRVPVGEKIETVLFIPDFEMPTEKARAVLSPLVPRGDAIFNLSRVALLVNSLVTSQSRYLRWATEDRLHQPQRQMLFPAMEQIFQAALGAGAGGVFLSGSGSTILALAKRQPARIGEAMLRAGAREGVAGKIVITGPVVRGAHVRGL
ncbi:MAG: homoserine kinase [Chloroflexi bacterium]|nr:homoserine kinase [Chloroflexota bacterium]